LAAPSLGESVVPGDHVVLAIEPTVPQIETIVAAVVDVLESAGVATSDISLLVADDNPATVAAGNSSGIDRFAPLAGRNVQIVRHDEQRREALSYLAATEAGRPIYLNRVLCDADFVLPIACARSACAVGCRGPASALYPSFSDSATQRRYRSPRLIEDRPDVAAQARHEIDQAAWWLGAHFGVFVVAGPNGEVREVVAGEIDAAYLRAQELHDDAWHRQLPERASLVIAAIDGPREEQTWENVGRALAAASRVVADDGAIAVCCDLADAPGAAVQGLAGGSDRRRVERQIRRERPDDTVPALVLLDALRRARVYLLSRLDPDVVEALDMAVVDDPADIARLASRHKSCVVLAGAQHATADAVESGAVR